MAISDRLRKQAQQRDEHCWHCGTTENLVLHHRKNRGAGGSKRLDRIDNLILVCHVYNELMESDAAVAAEARELGHKLESWRDFSDAVFDKFSGCWFTLTQDGRKEERGFPSYLI